VAAFVLLSLALHVVSPVLVREHGFQLLGIQFGVSDSNDAYVAAWRAMMAGDYPYYGRTFLGQPLSPMPGTLLMALPLYRLNGTAYQNILWLFVFWIALVRYTSDSRVASLLVLTVLAACPDLPYTIVQATDHASNGLCVLLGALGMLCAIQARRAAAWSLGAAAFLGLALSSRANFLLLLVPILFLGVLRHTDVRTAVRHLGVCLGVSAAVTAPFLLYDPAHFSPLHTAEKLMVSGRYPFAAEAVLASGLLLGTALGLRQERGVSLETVAARCFLVQLFAVLSGLLLASLAIGQPDLGYPHFGLMAMFFGVFASGPRLFRLALTPGAEVPPRRCERPAR